MKPAAFWSLLVFLSEITESTLMIISLGVTQLALCLVQAEVSLQFESNNKAIRSNFNIDEKIKMGTILE